MKQGSSISIKAVLLNLSQKENVPFQQIITRYLHERLLFRVSLSDYKSSFVLKGGNTFLKEKPDIFSEEFYRNKQRQIIWNFFLKKIKADSLDFEMIVKHITSILLPIYKNIIRDF
jgi:hypothetical protein